eukprot:scaffold16535_cov123-Cylindrotheca_fusiformis.AAC.2
MASRKDGGDESVVAGPGNDGKDDREGPTPKDSSRQRNVSKSTKSNPSIEESKKDSGGDPWAEDDVWLDFMDEEERGEEIFRTIVWNSMAGMLSPGELEELRGQNDTDDNGPPKDIFV